MKKWIAMICAVALTGFVLWDPVYTYYALAEETAHFTEGDVSGGDLATVSGNGSALTKEELEKIGEAQEALQAIAAEREIMALVYLSDELTVLSDYSYESDSVVTVPSGQQVQIQNVFIDQYREMWMSVTLNYQDQEFVGYLPRTYLACSDERFLSWEETFEMDTFSGSTRALMRSSRSAYPDIDQFPQSYQSALIALKQAHPNWTFVKMNTGLNWSTVVAEELKGGRSLIPSSFPSYMQTGKYSPGWAYASEDTLKYYLDPRNWLSDTYIFQFEQLTFNESYHTEAALQSFLNNTFMKGGIPNMDLTYARAIWAIGAELKVSPFHLASRIYQEQGAGTSPLISGKYSGYEGYYNYFNVGASGTTNEAVYRSGLKKAKDMGWTDPYKSIYGGADVITKNYIRQGQDTLYLQKFDVEPAGGLYWHQYMQNICAPSSEGLSIRKLYAGANSLDNTFVFKIPVYENMPGSACIKPGASYDVSITPPDGYTDPTIYLDGIAYSAVLRDGNYVVSALGGDVKTAVMYKYNGSGVPIGMSVWRLSHNGTTFNVTAVPELTDLLTYHGFSIRITGKAGIRFKTGISADLRGQLTGGGVAGYTLKEYGTLVMNNANRNQYPMVKNGEKVLSGQSYGYNESGNLEDKIYETVDGRYRFTSVLVGLPANQYKVEYAFRGYAVLNKDGQELIVYGPPVAKSIYSLAQQVLEKGQYASGSEADQFLRKLISDADSAG